MYARLMLAAAIAAGLVTPTLSISPAEAHSIGRSNNSACKNPVEGRLGLAVSKDKAKKRARRKWSYDVKSKYGYYYTSWDQAQVRDYHCNKKAGTWRCRAHAYPCFWGAS